MSILNGPHVLFVNLTWATNSVCLVQQSTSSVFVKISGPASGRPAAKNSVGGPDGCVDNLNTYTQILWWPLQAFNEDNIFDQNVADNQEYTQR